MQREHDTKVVEHNENQIVTSNKLKLRLCWTKEVLKWISEVNSGMAIRQL